MVAGAVITMGTLGDRIGRRCAAVAASEDLHASVADELLTTAREAFTSALQVGAFTSAVLAAATAGVAATFMRGICGAGYSESA